MDKLKTARLYGEGLVTIAAAELRGRYNECLSAIGLKPTGLERFSIDGAGWSPEIAAEKNEPDYLGLSETNRVAIIVTPDQRGKPLYSPVFSFERELLRLYFERHDEQVADITSDSALWVEFDFGLSQLRSPLDLLLIDRVIARTYVAGDLLQRARDQRALCERFLGTGEAWFSDELRRKLIESAGTVGDLRSRRIEIREMVFTDTRNFHARALGGVFVFRGLKKRDNVIIAEDPKQARKAPPAGTDLFSLPNPSWQRVLHEEGLLVTDLRLVAQQPAQLAYLQECILADAVSREDSEVPLEKLTSARKKTLVHNHQKAIPKAYFDLERLAKQLEQARTRQPQVEPDLEPFISFPNPNLPADLQALVWKLLLNICPYDVAKLYMYDKTGFYEQYRDWPENKKRWALAVIQKQWQPSR